MTTTSGPVVPGQAIQFTETVTNLSSALSNAQLSLPVPAGASFVSADGGGVLGTDGVVRWTLSSVPAGASGEVNVTLKAPTTTVVHAPLVVAAAVRNSAGQILAQAESVTFSFTVLSGTEAPPTGSLITLVVTDRANGALVSHTVAVNFTLAMLERLTSPRGKRMLADSLTVAPKIFAAVSANNRETDRFIASAGAQ